MCPTAVHSCSFYRQTQAGLLELCRKSERVDTRERQLLPFRSSGTRPVSVTSRRQQAQQTGVLGNWSLSVPGFPTLPFSFVLWRAVPQNETNLLSLCKCGSSLL